MSKVEKTVFTTKDTKHVLNKAEGSTKFGIHVFLSIVPFVVKKLFPRKGKLK